MKIDAHKTGPIIKGLFAIVVLLLIWTAAAMTFLSTAAAQRGPMSSSATSRPAAVKFPALVDVGSKQCIPCMMMEPVLDELRTEYAGVLRVEFIDVQVDPERATKLGVRGIPTQIFYDASGKERYRHMGYISKENVLKKFNGLGIKLSKKNPDTKTK